jgi:putative phage-type endonuclease
MSAPEARSPAWHAERRGGLGSSDAPAILGLSRHRRPIDIWLAKVGEAPEDVDNPLMEWGRRLEAPVAAKAREVTGIEWRCWTPALRCRDWPVAFAHVDRRGVEDEQYVGLEVKTAMSALGWGDPGEASIAEAHEIIPPDHAVQVAHQLLVTGWSAWYVAALVGYRDFRLYRFTRDAEHLDALLADERDFWRLVEERIPPEPDGSDTYRAFLARRLGPLTAELSATPEQQLLGARVLEAKRAADAATAAYELERQRLDRSMGDAAALTGPGWRAARTAPRTSTTWARVVKDAAAQGIDLAPHIAAHTSTGEPGFRFLATEEDRS